MRAPIDNPTIELRSIALSKDDPGDRYLENKPAFDKFGQMNLGDYEGKIYSEEQLLKEWLQEETEINETENFNYSRYGGYLNKRVKSTGFSGQNRSTIVGGSSTRTDIYSSPMGSIASPPSETTTRITPTNAQICFKNFRPENFSSNPRMYRPKHIQPLSVSGTYIVDTEKIISTELPK